MASQAKSALLLALTPKGGSSKGAPSEGMSDEEKSEEVSGAQDIIDAVKAGDAEGLKLALRSFVADCMASYDKEDEAGEG